MAVNGQQKGFFQGCFVSGKSLLQPNIIFSGLLQIIPDQLAVGNNGDGQGCLLRGHAGFFCGSGAFLGIGKNGKIPPCFQNGILHNLRIYNILFPKLADQFVQCYPIFSHIVLHKLPVFY